MWESPDSRGKTEPKRVDGGEWCCAVVHEKVNYRLVATGTANV